MQKFDKLNSPKEIHHEVIDSLRDNDDKKLNETITVTAKVTSVGNRIVIIENVMKEDCRVRRIINEVNLTDLAAMVERMNSRFENVSLEDRRAALKIVKRVCDLYSITDKQIEEGPFYTQVICSLTDRFPFPAYSQRARVELISAFSDMGAFLDRVQGRIHG